MDKERSRQQSQRRHRPRGTRGGAASPQEPAGVRARLLIGTGLLAVLQLAHLLDVLRYDKTASFPAVLADPLAVLGIGAASVAFVWTAQRHRNASAAAIAAGAAIAVGFVLQHGLPVDLGVNNPYWTVDGNRADLLRWATVLLLIGIGTWTARTAWNAGVAPPMTSRSSR